MWKLLHNPKSHVHLDSLFSWAKEDSLHSIKPNHKNKKYIDIYTQLLTSCCKLNKYVQTTKHKAPQPTLNFDLFVALCKTFCILLHSKLNHFSTACSQFPLSYILFYLSFILHWLNRNFFFNCNRLIVFLWSCIRLGLHLVSWFWFNYKLIVSYFLLIKITYI